MPRLQVDKASKGLAAQASPEVPPKLPAGIDPAAQFQQGNFAAVAGGPKAGRAKHPGAPDGGRGGGSVPGGVPLLGHKNVAASVPAVKGKSPKRGPGVKTAFTNPAVMD
jgi:hypothetical protein